MISHINIIKCEGTVSFALNRKSQQYTLTNSIFIDTTFPKLVQSDGQQGSTEDLFTVSSCYSNIDLSSCDPSIVYSSKVEEIQMNLDYCQTFNIRTCRIVSLPNLEHHPLRYLCIIILNSNNKQK